ncbi:MAG: hypothetical protein M1814_003393 [Vezdaea aestivalis]|nr:MAG: hypothetical protein M1814_003393 [Vezdaea aestivalis]
MEETLVKSTPPPPASITPPPSSHTHQKALLPASEIGSVSSQLLVARTPTPTASMSSPPPTIKATAPVQPVHASLATPSSNEISHASPAEIYDKFQIKADEVKHLSGQLQEARTAAAHFKLQNNLLAIETAEITNQMEVEQEMARREVELLRSGELRESRNLNSLKEESRTRELINGEIAQHAHNVQMENALLQTRLKRAKKLIALRDAEIETLLDQNDLLRHRIRANREHLNQYQSPGGPLNISTFRESKTAPNTPQRPAPRQGSSVRSTVRSQDPGKDTISALLLADQVLHQSHKGASSPSSRPRPSKAAGFSHTRNTHSLSSLPSSGQESRIAIDHNGVLLPPLSFSPARPAAVPRPSPQRRDQQRRRESRDSTISASNSENDHRGHSDREEDDEEVPESQASQLATSMLRHTQGAKIPPATSQAAKTGTLLQTKLLGSVSKGLSIYDSQGKKRGWDALESPDAQDLKRRKGVEGVGLGIGLGFSRT